MCPVVVFFDFSLLKSMILYCFGSVNVGDFLSFFVICQGVYFAIRQRKTFLSKGIDFSVLV